MLTGIFHCAMSMQGASKEIFDRHSQNMGRLTTTTKNTIIHGLEAAVSMAHSRRFSTATVLHNKICDEKRGKLSLIEANVSCTLSPSWPLRGSLLRDERAPFLPEEIVLASSYGSLQNKAPSTRNL